MERSDRLRILDAGCGSRIVHDFGDDHVTGIDISQAELDLNTRADEKILGDIQSYPFPAETYDRIVCWNTLEHVPNPHAALKNLVRALAPGGELVIGVPNLGSPKGLGTKLTPHRFHVWFHRHALGNADAGKPGHAPYKVYLRRSLTMRGLREFGRASGLEVLELRAYKDDGWFLEAIRSRPLSFTLWKTACAIFSLAGRDPEATEIVARFRKSKHA